MVRRAVELHGFDPLIETIAEASYSAEAKSKLSFGQVIVLGVIAAAYLALATTLAIAVGAGVEPPGIQKLVMGAVFPVGLIAVIVAVSELSTGNYLTSSLGAMTLRVGWKHTLSNWAGSYAGNFLGALLLAIVIIQGAHLFVGPMWGEQWVHLLRKIVGAKASLTPIEAFLRGILCIWLVDLAVWQAYRVKDNVSKFLLIWFPTLAFFTLGLEHSVVNMFLFPAAIFAGAEVSWSQFLVHNLIPVVLGNVVGGMFIVGMLYWYSAGLPVDRKLLGDDGKDSHRSSSGTIEQGSYGLLGLNLAKGLVVTVVFVGLFPGIAGLISSLLPADWGVLVPVVVAGYLVAAALAVSKGLKGIAFSWPHWAISKHAKRGQSLRRALGDPEPRIPFVKEKEGRSLSYRPSVERGES